MADFFDERADVMTSACLSAMTSGKHRQKLSDVLSDPVVREKSPVQVRKETPNARRRHPHAAPEKPARHLDCRSGCLLSNASAARRSSTNRPNHHGYAISREILLELGLRHHNLVTFPELKSTMVVINSLIGSAITAERPSKNTENSLTAAELKI